MDVVLCCLFCAAQAWAFVDYRVYAPGIGFSLRRIKAPVAHATSGRGSLSLAMQRTLALEMRKYSLEPKRLSLTPSERYKFYLDCLSKYPGEMRPNISKQYIKALSATARLAKTLDTEVFYQGTFENRHLNPWEIHDRLRLINSALQQVKAAKIYFDARGDAKLGEAEAYLLRNRRFYQMLGTGEFGSLEEMPLSALEKARKEYDGNRFYLRTPTIPENSDALLLPKRARVAIIREEEDGTAEIISAFHRVREEEQFSQWQFDAYRDMSEFLSTPGCLTYDLVITDIMMGGGGGLYLARQLRYYKFNGGIVALTGFPQKEETGIAMKAEGIDGALYTGHIKYEKNLSSFFAEKLRNYFYYKNQKLETPAKSVQEH